MLLVYVQIQSKTSTQHSILYAKYGILPIYGIASPRGRGGGGELKHNPTEKLYFFNKERIGCSHLARNESLRDVLKGLHLYLSLFSEILNSSRTPTSFHQNYF